MAKKITEDTIKKLIQQVLKEEQLNEKTKFVTRNGKGVFDDGEWSSITTARKDLDWGKKPSDDDWNSLKDRHPDGKVNGIEPLSFKDLEIASGKKSGKNKKAFDSLKPDLKKAVLSGGSTNDEEEVEEETEEEEVDPKLIADWESLKSKFSWNALNNVFALTRMNDSELIALRNALKLFIDKYKNESQTTQIKTAKNEFHRTSYSIFESAFGSIDELDDNDRKKAGFDKLLTHVRKFDADNKEDMKPTISTNFDILTKDIVNEKIKIDRKILVAKLTQQYQGKPIKPEKPLKFSPKAQIEFVTVRDHPTTPKLIFKLANVVLPTKGTGSLETGNDPIWFPYDNEEQTFSISASDAEDPVNIQKLFDFARESTERDKISKTYSLSDIAKSLKDDDTELSSKFVDNIKSLFNYDELIQLNEDKEKLDVGDFEFLFDNFDQYYDLIMRDVGTSADAAEKLQKFRDILVSTYNDSRTGQSSKEMLASVLAASKATGPVRSSLGTTSGYKITSRSAAGGSVDFQIINAFANAFPNNLTFEQRFAIFNDYVADLQNVIKGTDSNSEADEASVDQKFSKFIVLDMMQQIMYDFEASSAGWVFESFLAFMAFGEAIGAGYGAGDFTIEGKDKDGNTTKMDGSAKLLQKGSTSQNFSKMKGGEVIKYVIGVKSTKVGDEFAPTRQEDRVGKLVVYIVDVECLGEDGILAGETGEILVKWNSGGQKLQLVKGRADLKVPKETESPAGEMNFLFLQENQFQDVSDLIVRDIGVNLEQAMKSLNSVKANMDNYVLNFNKPEERLIYSDEAMRSYANLKNTLIPDDKKEIFGGNIQERKVTAKMLQKLISESFKR